MLDCPRQPRLPFTLKKASPLRETVHRGAGKQTAIQAPESRPRTNLSAVPDSPASPTVVSAKVYKVAYRTVPWSRPWDLMNHTGNHSFVLSFPIMHWYQTFNALVVSTAPAYRTRLQAGEMSTHRL
jgi:hypothetical protein